MTGPEEPTPPLHLVQGGTPATRAIAAFLDDPEVRARYAAAFAEAGRQLGEYLDQLAAVLAPAVEAFARLGEQLREAGALPEVPPEDPRARALWLRQHRGTGPDRPSGQRAHPPRRIG